MILQAVTRNQSARASVRLINVQWGAAMGAENAQTWVIAAVILLALVAAAWLITREQRRKQSQRLQQRFGPEYSRVISERGDRTRAEAELLARERRVERLKLISLSTEEATRFSQAWNVLQTQFIDNPRGVVVEADRLVRDLMVKRGYPMGDFDRRAADISVDYPTVVEAYRCARAIAVRDRQGHASTEELRKAVVYYRTLFDELLEVRHPRQFSATNTEAVHT